MWQWQYGNHPPLRLGDSTTPWWSRNGAVAQSGQGPRDRSRGGRQEITGGKNLTLYEVDEATTRIREVDADANIIVGATFDRQCPPTHQRRRKIVPRCRRRHPGGRKYCSARKRASNS
jgi:hypothetical protein